jgi:AraC-like DNA-binding protein
MLAHHWTRPENPNETFHRHNEVELNLLCSGKMSQMIAGRSHPIPAKRLCVFWAGFSHRIIGWEPGEVWSQSVPLTDFLEWSLPQENFVHRLLHGDVLIEADENRWPYDLDLMQRWHADLNGAHAVERQQIVLLEIRARLTRLAGSTDRANYSSEPRIEPGRMDQMLLFIARNYQEDLSVSSIAESAGLTPSYAMELFKQSTGMSIMQYVNDQRLSHARRMLATSNSKILDVAMQSGFGSASQFYNVFRKVCGETPRHYARVNSVQSPQEKKSKHRKDRLAKSPA